MDSIIKTLRIVWEGITIDISYNPDYSKAFREVYGHPMAHLEIRAEGRKRLPFTETGYRSHFIYASSIEEHGVRKSLYWIGSVMPPSPGIGWIT